MADVHRKIELQEQDDLRYLVDNVRRTANQKIDLALPPIEGEDALRRRVEALVHDYISTTFQSASPNLSINGHNPSAALLDSLCSSDALNGNSHSSAIEEYEPLDEKLLTHAADLTRQEEDLLMEISALRREAPKKAAEAWRDGFKNDGEAARAALAMEKNSEGVKAQLVDLDIGKLERQDEVEKTWERGVEGLGRLKREMPGTAARMERAKRAVEYVLAER